MEEGKESKSGDVLTGWDAADPAGGIPGKHTGFGVWKIGSATLFSPVDNRVGDDTDEAEISGGGWRVGVRNIGVWVQLRELKADLNDGKVLADGWADDGVGIALRDMR